MNTNRAKASTKLMSDAGGANNSFGDPPGLSVYCTGSTDSQFEIRMYTKSVTASGNTNGAIRIPIADSIWLRIWTVIASKNSCTPPGTPLEVTLARKNNASPMTMTAARPAEATVSTLTVRPNHWAVLCWPPSMAPSASIGLVIAVSRPFTPVGGPVTQLVQDRQRGRQHQQYLK